jgi:hypothetical protein
MINSVRRPSWRPRRPASLVGNDNLKRDLLPSVAAEDFACFLEQKPGASIGTGNGNAEGAAMLHNSN